MTVAYVESSALVKLVVPEAESSTLRTYLGTMDSLVASRLSVVELTRSAGRSNGDDGLAQARATLLRFELLPIDTPIVEAAATMFPRELRSLDAIHVASALALASRDLVFCSYDQRALAAAQTNGLRTASPGVD